MENEGKERAQNDQAGKEWDGKERAENKQSGDGQVGNGRSGNEQAGWKQAWMFFSVAAAALDDKLELSTLTRWAETGLFTSCPFCGEDRYIRQGVRQMRLWLEDFQEDPRIEERREQDYLQLFIGAPKPLAPFWGSVYMEEDQLLFHDTTAQAGKWYRKYGLGVSREKGMPEDSCLYELLFTTALLEGWQADIKEGREEEARARLQDLKAFISGQMLPWIPLWREDVMLYGRTEYYRGLSNMIYGGVCRLAEMEVAHETGDR